MLVPKDILGDGGGGHFVSQMHNIIKLSINFKDGDSIMKVIDTLFKFSTFYNQLILNHKLEFEFSVFYFRKYVPEITNSPCQPRKQIKAQKYCSHGQLENNIPIFHKAGKTSTLFIDK